MNKRSLLILACLTFTVLACATSSVQPPATLPPTVEASATPETSNGAGQAESPSAPTTSAPVAPLETVWPLPADLFYLNESGQIWRQPSQGDESTAVQVSREGDVITDFAVAPGGQWLLFRVGGAVAVTALDGSSGQVLAPQAGAPADVTQGRTMSWSPDAARIAYVTADGFQIYIPGGATTLEPLIFAVPTADAPVVDLGWSPDSRWLLVRRADGDALLADADDPQTLRLSDLGKINAWSWLDDNRLMFAPLEGGLALVEPGQLDTRTFLVEQTEQVDVPTQWPDGSVAFYVHEGGLDQPGVLFAGHLADSVFQPVGRGIQTAGLGWQLDGGRLIGRGDGPALRVLDPTSGAEGRITTQGTPTSFAWGAVALRGVTSLPLPANLYFLAEQSGVTQVWRLPANGDPPEPITNASFNVLAYDISDDGTQLTFTSNNWVYRSVIGTPEIQQVAQLATEPHSPSGTPSFSPTGRRIAFANNGIWVYDLTVKDVRRLVVDIAPPTYSEDKTEIYDQPVWSPDGLWLLLRVTYFQGQDHALLPSGGGFDPAPFNQFNAQARWGADGAVYVYSDGTTFGQPSLTRMTPARPPIVKKLLSVPVLDVQTRPDGRLAILKSPSPFPFGPTSTRIFSMTPDGEDLQPETPSLVLEKPILSPDAVLVAGLARTVRGADGVVSGELVIVNPATKDMFVLDGMPSVHDLMWGN